MCTNLITDILIIQIFCFTTIFYFICTITAITLWTLAGLYLFGLGLLLLFNEGDIFIGFLWIIDLGVGLIFLIFILHFSYFLFQKTYYNLSNKILIFLPFFFISMLIFFNILANAVDFDFNKDLNKIWFFLVSWFDYYNFYTSNALTELNLIREIYFYQNTFEFFLINFMLFFGIFSTIILIFLIKRTFNIWIEKQIKNYKLIFKTNAYLFIRNQNYIKQQNTSTGTRVWLKKKKFKI